MAGRGVGAVLEVLTELTSAGSDAGCEEVQLWLVRCMSLLALRDELKRMIGSDAALGMLFGILGRLGEGGTVLVPARRNLATAVLAVLGTVAGDDAIKGRIGDVEGGVASIVVHLDYNGKAANEELVFEAARAVANLAVNTANKVGDRDGAAIVECVLTRCYM